MAGNFYTKAGWKDTHNPKKSILLGYETSPLNWPRGGHFVLTLPPPPQPANHSSEMGNLPAQLMSGWLPGEVEQGWLGSCLDWNTTIEEWLCVGARWYMDAGKWTSWPREWGISLGSHLWCYASCFV